MSDRRNFEYKGTVIPATMAAGAFLAIITIFGVSIMPEKEKSGVAIDIIPSTKVSMINETFDLNIDIKSDVPVNVFSGELNFNHDVLAIESINYNTGVADLWAEEPWYSNGAGTMNFVGGTTQSGGFSGKDTLITVTFRTITAGEGTISLEGTRILLHDGLGTDAELDQSIDTLIVVDDPKTTEVSTTEAIVETTYKVVEQPPSTDLNGDGKQSMADISIFMLNIAGDDLRYDFNLDGEVDIKDLNIILDAK